MSVEECLEVVHLNKRKKSQLSRAKVGIALNIAIEQEPNNVAVLANLAHYYCTRGEYDPPKMVRENIKSARKILRRLRDVPLSNPDMNNTIKEWATEALEKLKSHSSVF